MCRITKVKKTVLQKAISGFDGQVQATLKDADNFDNSSIHNVILRKFTGKKEKNFKKKALKI